MEGYEELLGLTSLKAKQLVVPSHFLLTYLTVDLIAGKKGAMLDHVIEVPC